MSRLATLTAGLLLLAATGAQSQQPGLKIGYINSQAILAQAPGAQEAQTQFNQEMQVWTDEMTRMQTQIDSMVRQYDQQQLTMSPAVKQQRENEIRAANQTMTDRAQQLDQQMNARQNELVQPVMDVINQVIETIREEGSYSLIFDVAAGSIIAADPTLDLTDEVVRRLLTQPSLPAGAG